MGKSAARQGCGFEKQRKNLWPIGCCEDGPGDRGICRQRCAGGRPATIDGWQYWGRAFMQSQLMTRRIGMLGIGLATMMAAAGCATVPEGDPEALAAYEEANDPLEPANRYFFEVNYALDELLLKPIAGWYYVALPNPVQDSIRNAIRNLATPVVLANDLMQGSTSRAGTTSMRFLINSTAGLLGLFDVASGL